MMKLSIITLLMTLLMNKFVRDPIEENVILEEYDFIVVGAGTSGCVVASRLSEDPNVKILLVEAGHTDWANPDIEVPANILGVQGTPKDWNYTTAPQKNAQFGIESRTENWPRGKVLGGSSSMNAMIYIRGSEHDYNSWEEHGALGWGWNEVEPYFQKAEGAVDDDTDVLGKDGPLKLTKRYTTPMHDLLMKAGEEIGMRQVEYTEDMEGISAMQSTVYNGVRQNSATAYLRPIFQQRKDRLHVMLGAQVIKILLTKDGKPRATGVKYVKNGKIHEVNVLKDVILSGGSIGTPHLLMLSGIGPKQHLTEMGIDVVVDLPGVGSNLQDHIMFMTHFHVSRLSDDAVVTTDSLKDSILEYIQSGDGQLSLPLGLDTFAHFNTDLAATNISTWTKKYPFPEIQMLFLNGEGDAAGFPQPLNEKEKRVSKFIATINLMHPKSVGTVRLSSNDWKDYPIIDPKYLSNDDDVKVFIEAIRTIEKFENSKTFKKIGAKIILPPYCGARRQKKIPRSDELYRCMIKFRTYTEYHPCGTAKIGKAEDRMAVVDPRLRVYRVDGLRVADASVMPHETSANLQAPCYMIGEKAADMIKEDWKL